MLFTVGWLDVTPYVGFYHTSSGEITGAYGPGAPEHLRVGDQIIEVDGITWQAYEDDLRLQLFKGAQTGDTLKLTVIRADEEITVDWTIPSKTPQEVINRLINIWWLAYVFWIAGTATLLLVRPRDTRWKLMVAFNYLTAIWLIAGNMSSSHLLESPLVMRFAIWLCMPVYLQLHWNLPQPLTRTPKALWYSLYALAFVGAIAQWFQLIPKSSYLFAFLIAITGSIILLLLHLLRKEQRRDVSFLLLGTLLTMIPQVLPALAEFDTGFNALYIFAFLALPFLPTAYFYTLYRRQLVGMELRANHLISGYIYLIVVMIAFSLWLPFALERFSFQGAGAFISLLSVFLATLITILGYDRFGRFVERRILNMPLASSELLQSYTDRIATSLDIDSLTHLINEEVLPSLLIRQSALLNLSKEQQVEVVCSKGIAPDQLPPESQVTQMSASHSPFPDNSNPEEGHTWVRLALPLRLGDELVGLWLLGQRDPDNIYNANDVNTLRSLANQTAIALANINQAEMLQMLYRANISSQEIERGRLARDLHDVVLNQLALLIMKLDEAAAEAFHEDYQALTRYLRQTIQGLRPPALNYGLRTALEAFCDDLSDRANGDLNIEFDIEPCDTHFDPTVESHLYRIIQQAGENAIRHAKAKNLYLYGKISQTEVELHLRDDGVGFNTRSGLDLSSLLSHEHFGLVGMYERARIINAQLKIESQPEKGTTITVIWRPDDLPAS